MFKHFSKDGEATQQGATNSSPPQKPFDEGKIKEAMGFAADDPNVTVEQVPMPQQGKGDAPFGFGSTADFNRQVDELMDDILGPDLREAGGSKARQGLPLAQLLECGCRKCLDVARDRDGYQDGAPRTSKPSRAVSDIIDDILKRRPSTFKTFQEKLRDIKRQEREAEDNALFKREARPVGATRAPDYRDGNNADAITAILTAVGNELAKAEAKHAPMNSAHEGHSVIREEVEELWDHVKADTGYSMDARKEAIQIAAMAVRYILNLRPGDPHRSAR